MADLDGEAHRELIVCAKATSMGLHRSAVLPTRPMIFAALVAHLRIHRIQIFEQAALEWIKALGNLPRSTYLGALLVGLQESAREDESAANEGEANDDQRDTRASILGPPKWAFYPARRRRPMRYFRSGLPDYRLRSPTGCALMHFWETANARLSDPGSRTVAGRLRGRPYQDTSVSKSMTLCRGQTDV
jgi:hypothetical protein